METEFQKLECLFTWNIDQLKILDLNNLPQKLNDRIRFCPPQYHSTYYNILAFLCHLEGKNESALQYLHKAEETLQQDLRQKKDFLVTYSSFAWVYFYLKRVDSAQDYLNKVKEIHQNAKISLLPVIYGEKGWSFLRLGGNFYEQSKESFSKALEEEPNNVLCNVGYAIVMYRLEGIKTIDTSEAREQLRKALSLDPTNAEIMVLLALKLQRSRTEEAQNLIKDALKMSSDVPHVTRYVAKYFRLEFSIRESLSMLEKAVELTPNSSFLHHQIGLCHYRLFIQMMEESRSGKRFAPDQKTARITKCIQHYTKAVKLKPSNVFAQINLAEAYAENKHLTKAEEIFTKMIADQDISESARQHCHTRYGLFCLYKKRDEAKAIGHFKMAYKIPKDGNDRKQASKRLKQIAERNLNTKGKAREAREILILLAEQQSSEARSEIVDVEELMRLKLKF